VVLKFYLGCSFQPPSETVAMTTHAERLGYAGVAVPDHLFYPVEPSTPYPYSADGCPPFPLDAPWPDIWVLLGTLGALTSTIHLRTNVFILPLRHPLVVARAVGTAAVMTNGRVELGVGVGHLRDEFDALGVDFRTRGRRADEAITALRALLRPGPVSHDGDIWHIRPVYLHPAPEAPVPIFVGGESKAALERAARLGDGYVSVPRTMEQLEALMTELTKLRDDLAPERPPLRFHVDCSDARSIGDYRRLADAGAEVVKVDYRHLPHATLEERLELMQEFADSVIERM
jgi:probable F420-dependent oxidoreductase